MAFHTNFWMQQEILTSPLSIILYGIIIILLAIIFLKLAKLAKLP
jgi:hypothetical protein